VLVHDHHHAPDIFRPCSYIYAIQTLSVQVCTACTAGVLTSYTVHIAADGPDVLNKYTQGAISLHTGNLKQPPYTAQLLLQPAGSHHASVGMTHQHRAPHTTSMAPFKEAYAKHTLTTRDTRFISRRLHVLPVVSAGRLPAVPAPPGSDAHSSLTPPHLPQSTPAGHRNVNEMQMLHQASQCEQIHR
jgi:hypothetical protein